LDNLNPGLPDSIPSEKKMHFTRELIHTLRVMVILSISRLGERKTTLRQGRARIHVVVRPVKFRKLPLIYTVYFEAFRHNSLQNIYNMSERKIKTITVLRTIAVRLIHVLLARLSVAARIGSILPLFQTRWDPIPFEIVVNCEVVGCCFLVRLSRKAVELGIIGVLKTKRGMGIGAQAVEAIKEYARKMGVSRMIAGSGPRRTGSFFKKCGFKHGFSEYVLYFNLREPRRDC
jgi:GNAT superfamily N-acetyltransferase